MKLGCLLSLVLCCRGAGASRAALGARRMATKDAMDSEDSDDVQFLQPADDGPSLDEQQGGSSGGSDADAMVVQMKLKAAQDRAKMMHQFMNNFARNMRRSVLQDSEGDIPEDQRLAMLQQLGGAQSAGDGDQPQQDPSEAYIRERRHYHKHHMLNGGRSAGGSHPEHHHRHHHMMLNARKVEHGEADADAATEGRDADAQATQRAARAAAESEDSSSGNGGSDSGGDESPPAEHDRRGHEIVADELGRKMPLLFGGPSAPVPAAKKSKAHGAIVSATTALALLLATGANSF